MAYKKYIKRGGKVYGPYVYHSKRVDGKVVSEYMGSQKGKPDFKKISLGFLGIFVLITLVFFFNNFGGEITGRSVLNFDSINLDPEAGLIDGSLNLSLQEEDFIPATSKLIFENEGKIFEFYLKDLINNSEIMEKEIYPLIYFNLIIESEEQVPEKKTEEVPEDIEEEEEKEKKEENPKEVESNVTSDETIPKTNETVSDGGVNDEGEEETGDSKTEETPEPNEDDETEEENDMTEEDNGEEIESETETYIDENEATEDEVVTEEETTETSEDNKEEEFEEESNDKDGDGESAPSPITGGVIGTNEGEDQILISKIGKIISGFFLGLRTTGYAIENSVVVSGDVSFDQDFVYDFGGQSAESVVIESGSVRTDSKNLSEDDIEIKTEDNKIIVTTNYSEFVEGFSGTDLIVEMSDLNMTFSPGEWKVKIVEPDSDKELISFLITIGGDVTMINETETLFLQEIIELNDLEREILRREFGENVSVDISEAVEKNNLLVIKYELADYEMIRSYDLDLSRQVIESFMKRDRIKLLKDIAMTISREEEPGKTREEFLGEWHI